MEPTQLYYEPSLAFYVVLPRSSGSDSGTSVTINTTENPLVKDVPGSLTPFFCLSCHTFSLRVGTKIQLVFGYNRVSVCSRKVHYPIEFWYQCDYKVNFGTSILVSIQVPLIKLLYFCSTVRDMDNG